MEKIKNYRKIKLPDCCAVCKHSTVIYDLCKNNIYWEPININGLCDDFEREKEE